MHFSLRLVEEIDSTNERLFTAPLAEIPMNTALLAKRQTGGRGRGTREWVSESGGLYMSILFLPPTLEALSLWGALCVVEMCEEKLGLSDLVIRWPNDVYCRGRKLAGVLPQVKFWGSKVERAVLGVGLNVKQSLESFPLELRDSVVTLQGLTGVDWSVEEIARILLCYFESRLPELALPGRVAELCQPRLEGHQEGAQAFAVEEGSGVKRALGRVLGLGERGELLLESGPLDNLGPHERLRFQ